MPFIYTLADTWYLCTDKSGFFCSSFRCRFIFIGQSITIYVMRIWMVIWFIEYISLHTSYWFISFILDYVFSPGSSLFCSEGIHFPVASYTFHAMYFASVLPPCFEPAQTQNSALLSSTSSCPVFGNRDLTGGGLMSNFFVLQFNQVFIFAAFHSLGSIV